MAEYGGQNSKAKEAEAYSFSAVSPSIPNAPPADGDDDLPPPYEFCQPPPLSRDLKYPEAKKNFELPVTVTTEEQVRTSLKGMAKSVLSSAKRLSDNFVKDENVFYYKLETMYEKRGTVEATVPYYGEQIDGPSNGPAPGLWDIPVFPAVPFKDAEFRAEAPHTSQIAQCFKCNAQGTVNCLWCGGSSTRGMGSSRRTCAACTGSGKSKCPTCKGQCQLKRFVQLVVIFTCRTMECMDNPTSLSDDKAKAAEGHMVVDERAERVNKLADFPSKVISAASAQLIDMSLSQFPVERVVEQRQTVKLVPVATTNYGFGKKNGSVRLYGLDRRTDASDNDSSCSIS